jgi:hypothetical protein
MNGQWRKMDEEEGMKLMKNLMKNAITIDVSLLF